MKLNTYLFFKGNCQEAFKFYQKALGAKIIMMMRYGESPAAEETAKEFHDKIMHARIELDGNVLMGSDSHSGDFQRPAGFSVSINVEAPAEAERLFKALSEKAEICMPMAETFWAHRFGMLTDQFGVPWMINCEKKS